MELLKREYRWYLTGCDRLGHTPLDETTFSARWQEYEDHAERLKAADTEGKLDAIAARARSDMQQRVNDDPFLKAVLVGMSEEQARKESLR